MEWTQHDEEIGGETYTIKEGWQNGERIHYIKTLKRPSPPLTLEEHKEAKTRGIRGQASDVILRKYPVWFQSNVALGIYDEAIGDAMKAGIAAVITESNRCEDLVDAALTIEKVQAVTPVWPTL